MYSTTLYWLSSLRIYQEHVTNSLFVIKILKSQLFTLWKPFFVNNHQHSIVFQHPPLCTSISCKGFILKLQQQFRPWIVGQLAIHS